MKTLQEIRAELLKGIEYMVEIGGPQEVREHMIDGVAIPYILSKDEDIPTIAASFGVFVSACVVSLEGHGKVMIIHESHLTLGYIDFIVAHEVGHLVHGHTDNIREADLHNGTKLLNKIDLEKEADAYAFHKINIRNPQEIRDMFRAILDNEHRILNEHVLKPMGRPTIDLSTVEVPDEIKTREIGMCALINSNNYKPSGRSVNLFTVWAYPFLKQ